MPQMLLPEDVASPTSTGDALTPKGGGRVQRFHSFSQPKELAGMKFEEMKKMDGRELAEEFFPLPDPSKEFEGTIDPATVSHVMEKFKFFRPLQEMAVEYNWSQELISGMLTKKVFLKAKHKTTELSKFNSKTALYCGRALSKSLQDSTDATKGVFRWMKKNPAMKTLSDKHIFFTPFVLTVAQNLKLAKSLKVLGRQGYRKSADTAKIEEVKELQRELRRMSLEKIDISAIITKGGIDDDDDDDDGEEDDYDDDEVDEGLMSRLGDAEDRVLDVEMLLETGNDIDETDQSYVTIYAPPTKRKRSIFGCFKKKRIGYK